MVADDEFKFTFLFLFNYFPLLSSKGEPGPRPKVPRINEAKVIARQGFRILPDNICFSLFHNIIV